MTIPADVLTNGIRQCLIHLMEEERDADKWDVQPLIVLIMNVPPPDGLDVPPPEVDDSTHMLEVFGMPMPEGDPERWVRLAGHVARARRADRPDNFRQVVAAGLLSEAWMVKVDFDGEDAIAKAEALAKTRDLSTHPDARETRTLGAVDTTGAAYLLSQVRGTPEVSVELAPHGDGSWQGDGDVIEYALFGLLHDLLDAITGDD